MVPSRTRCHHSNKRSECANNRRPTSAASPPRSIIAWKSRRRWAQQNWRRRVPEIALEPVANDHLGCCRPQNSFGDIGPPGRGDGEGRGRRRDDDPQPYSDPTLPPRGLVNIRRGCCPHMLPNFFDRSLQLDGTLTLEPGDHPDGDRQAQQVGHQVTDRSFAQAIRPGQDAEDSPLTREPKPPWVPPAAEPRRSKCRNQGRSDGGVGIHRRRGKWAVLRRLGDGSVRGHHLGGLDRTSCTLAACT